MLEISDLGRFRKKRDCTFRVAKTKALISFAVTAKLICVFVFVYAKSWFSHDAAQIEALLLKTGFLMTRLIIFVFQRYMRKPDFNV